MPLDTELIGAPLVELERQRPDFVGGPGVILADGKEWHFARPFAYFRINDDGITTRRVWNLGDEYDKLMIELEEGGGKITIDKLMLIELKVAAIMLRRNYDLSFAEVGELVRFGYGAVADPDATRMREQVMDIAFGLDESPKAPSGG